MAAILARLLNIFSWSQQQEDDFKTKVDHAIVRLELILERVNELRYKFESRIHELRNMIVTLVRQGEKTRAAIYAGELVQVRNVLKMVKTVENMIIMTKERLRTVSDSRQLAEVLMTFGAALEEVKDQAKTLYPGLAYAFEEISKNVKTLIVQTSLDGLVNIDPVVISNQALNVLNEALKQADGEIKKSFPEPPVEPIMKVVEKPENNENKTSFVKEKTPSAKINKYEKPSITSSAVHHEQQSTKASISKLHRRPRANIEQLLLEYIREHGGFLDIRDFIDKYGFSRDEVFQALHRMAKKGLITIA